MTQGVPLATTEDVLQRVAGAALTNTVPPQWRTAQERIASERSAIERWLDDGGEAYGFTTLLGHLDDTPMTWTDQERTRSQQAELLAGHQLGRALRVPLGRVRSGLILAAKVEQLHRGGSGVSPPALGRYITAVEQGRALALPLALSYSCADVVPNAWVIHELFSGSDDLLAPGDLIALLGGHALPAAEAIPLVCALAYLVATYNNRWSAVENAMRCGSQVQLPVSLRDPNPVHRESASVVNSMLIAISSRLQTQAANPLFIFDDDGGVRQVDSTSGFLDFSLTAAAERASTLVVTLSHLTQRLVEHVVDVHDRRDPAGQHRRIQYPKVGQALSLHARASHRESRVFLGDASRGVEDLWDLSLISLQTLALIQERLYQQFLLLDELLATNPLSGAPVPADDALAGASATLSDAGLQLAPPDLARLVLEVHPSWSRCES